MTPKPFAFVIMPFSEAFRDTYLLGIKPACEDAGYYCERLDEQIFEERMLDRIYNQIAKADLVIADLSERNPNVFYEVGYAHALGKKVILLTRNSEDIPFDLKHHFHIVYSSGIAELKSTLRVRASYYLAHPETPTRNPFDQLALLLNGNPVSWSNSPTELAIPLIIAGEDNDEVVLPIEACFHLSENALESELDLEVRLITDSTFPSSGMDRGRGNYQIYTIIAMLNGKVMRKPLNSVRLSIGDPDKISFLLVPCFAESPIGKTHEMILRLISGGLIRDVLLRVVPSSY